MPQNPQLQDLLLNRAGQDTGQPLPEEIPGHPPNMIDKGMDFLLSAAGLRDAKPGNPYSGTGAFLGAVAPMLPFGKMAGALKGLSGVAQAPAEAEQLSPILQQIFSENPKARALYERAMATQVSEALAAKQAAGQARFARGADTHDALLDLLVDRPRPIPTETGFATAIPTEVGRIPQTAGSSNVAANAAIRMQRAGLTEEMIRDIRQIGAQAAQTKYQNIPSQTLREIATGQSYNGVK